MGRTCVPPGDIVSLQEIADHYGENLETVKKWFTRYPEPPDPIATVTRQKHRIYDLIEVHLWLVDLGPSKFRDRGR